VTMRAPDGDRRRKLEAYAELLATWNRRINLTAARSPEDILRVHVADCRALVRHIPADTERLLDVGAGGGLPGIVLAIERPEMAVTLLEPTHKKRAFLAAAARELALGRVRALAERLEDHGEHDYDVAVSRATWPVEEWLERGLRHVRPGGRVLAMEGRAHTDLPAGCERHPYELGDRARAILVLSRR